MPGDLNSGRIANCELKFAYFILEGRKEGRILEKYILFIANIFQSKHKGEFNE